jgi:hypothetical protein
MMMIEICIHQRQEAFTKMKKPPALLLSYLETKDSIEKLAANLMFCDSLEHLIKERGKELTFD